MNNTKCVVENVLKSFLQPTLTKDESLADTFMGLIADDYDVELLSIAIVEALERAK